MKKPIFALFTALCLAAGLTACGSGEAAQTQPPAPPAPEQTAPAAQSQAPAAPEGYVFVADTAAGPFAISINQDMAEVLSALGEPQSYFEAASCAFEGLDKTYTYSGFQITTRPEGDKDYVNSILLTDDSVTTPEGLYIGASQEDLQFIYGTGSSEENASLSATFTLEDVTLSIILDSGKVISIEYLPA